MAYTRKLPSGKHQAGYRDANGKQRSSGTYATRKEALAAAVRAEEQSHARPAAASITWGEWEKRWTRKVQPSTIAADESRLEKYIRPRWRDTPLDQIKHRDVQAWVDRIDAAASTVKKIGSVFSASLRDAVKADVIEFNPAANLTYKKPGPSPERWLSKAETEALREAMPPGDDRDFYDLLIGTGMRFGEGAGLHWDQVDLDGKTITVRWSADRGRGFKAPKSGKARVLPIGARLANVLRVRLDRSGLGSPPDDAVYVGGNRPLYGLVFSSRTGGPVNNRQFGGLVSAAARVTRVGGRSLDGVRVHDLRHSYASQLVQQGVPLDTVQKLLGHSSVLVTQRYADAGTSQWDAVRSVLG